MNPTAIKYDGVSYFIANGVIQCETHKTDWCDEVAKLVRRGKDSLLLHPGITLDVPIIPTSSLFAQVTIETEVYGESALMHMNYAPEIGRPFEIGLGFWSPGEGCLVIRTVIIDYLKSKLEPGEKIGAGPFKSKCPNRAHSLKSSRLMEEGSSDPLWKWHCLWNIVMEKACTPCLEEGRTLPDTNFGIDPDLASNPAPWNR